MKIRCFKQHEVDTSKVSLIHELWLSDIGWIHTKSIFWVCHECGIRNTVTEEHKDFKELDKLSTYR